MYNIIERENRRIDYLRISVTDRCNLRCIYCMPEEGISAKSCFEVLTFEEIIRLVDIFADLGIKKVRLTGGEPLVRRGIVDLVRNLARVESIEETALTTNGMLLSYYAQQLKKAGLSRINVSLDTLRREKFRMITRIDALHNVIEGIQRARTEGFLLKLNMVVMNGINEDEIIDFVKFALSAGIVLRFIEFMEVTPLWRKDYFLPIEIIRQRCKKLFRLKRIYPPASGPAEYYQLDEGVIGFIKTDENNCMACTRLRLTSTGELRLCLYETGGLDLRYFLRNGSSNNYIQEVIRRKIEAKKEVNYKLWDKCKVYMSGVGG